MFFRSTEYEPTRVDVPTRCPKTLRAYIVIDVRTSHPTIFRSVCIPFCFIRAVAPRGIPKQLNFLLIKYSFITIVII
jgi:hypothetical protein